MTDQELKPCFGCGEQKQLEVITVDRKDPSRDKIKCRHCKTSAYRKWWQSPQQINSILFDGFAVYEALSDKEKRYTTPENVSAVLDAVVRAIKADQLEKGEEL